MRQVTGYRSRCGRFFYRECKGVVFGGKENLVAKGRGETPRLFGAWIALLAAILAAAVLVLLAPVSED
jgi:hypothetical protein